MVPGSTGRGMEWQERKENSKGFVFKGLGSDLLENPGRWPQLSQPRVGEAGVFICHLQPVWVRAAPLVGGGPGHQFPGSSSLCTLRPRENPQSWQRHTVGN